MVKPKIAVLLAAYNGLSYLPQQVESILAQKEVELTLFVSVDSSSDGTEDWVDRLAQNDPQVKILPHGRHFGSAAKNFFRLLLEVDLLGFDFVAFADQDDIWFDDKLIRHAQISKNQGADGVSSNVIAFWPDGRQNLINKAQLQRKFDYLFESAGPGCTFLITPWLANTVKGVLADTSGIACQVALHDWLVYAVCRASGKDWVIDKVPSMMYRQHGGNEFGANLGMQAKYARFVLLYRGWYRNEVLKIVNIVCGLSQAEVLHKIKRLLSCTRFAQHLRLLKFVGQARRKFSERLFLAFMIVLGIF